MGSGRRILFLITDLKIGGMPSIVRDTVVRLANRTDALFEVACLAPWGPVADQISAAGVRTTPLGAAHQLDLRLFARLRRFIVENRFDTVFSFLVHANAAAAIISRSLPNVRFLQCIQTTQPKPRWHWRAMGIVHRAAECVVVPSESVAAALRERSRIPENKLVLIPNAVEPSEFPPSPIPFQSPQPEPFPVGFIGRLDPVKRLPDLLEATRLLAGRIHLHVFGDGAERPVIESEIVRLNLAQHVTLHGSVPHAQIAHQQIGLLVLPSIAEGLPMVLIEAMAARIPIVATDAPGIRDVIRHNHNGLLVPPKSPTRLAAAIEAMLTNIDLRRRLVDNAAAEVESDYAWPSVLEKYSTVVRLR